MARKKTTIKAKEPIRLRFKKLANGNQSIYLEQYDPKTQQRSYEFLKTNEGIRLILVPETDATAKVLNENTMLAANKIKAERIMSLISEGTGVKRYAIRSKVLLKDWIQTYRDRKKKAGRSDATVRNIDKVIIQLVKYKGEKVTIGEVDKKFCEGFLEFLAGRKTITGQPLAKVTQAQYFKQFRMALGAAVKENIIAENPALQVDRDLKPTIPESKREYLSVEELKKLISTPCCNEATKTAYVFSCFCGLRCSDIVALTWGNIKTEDGITFIDIVMQKTRIPLQVPLSDEAIKWMPERGNATDTDKVFSLPTKPYMNIVIKKWAKAAGISKRLSFHTARHTFATMELNAGADIYTTSKLLGHTNVKTTQIYTKVQLLTKGKAVNLVSNLFNE